jgi:hypothetical protein
MTGAEAQVDSVGGFGTWANWALDQVGWCWSGC